MVTTMNKDSDDDQYGQIEQLMLMMNRDFYGHHKGLDDDC